MTASTYIPRIFLTNDPKLANYLASPTKTGNIPYNSFTQFIDSYKQEPTYNENTYIYMSIDNTNILNFEHRGGKLRGESDTSDITLEFLSTTEEFEYTFLKRSFYRVGPNGDIPPTEDLLRFFIAYGVGDNLSNFTPFYRVSLISAATFQNFDQPRSVQLNFGFNGKSTVLNLINSSRTAINPTVLNDLQVIGQSIGPMTLSKRSYGQDIKEIIKNNIISQLRPGDKDPTLTNLLNHDPAAKTNSDLIGKYIFGFNRLDFMYKEAITNFLKAAELRNDPTTSIANVFVVSESLPELAIIGTDLDNIKTKKVLVSENLKESDYNGIPTQKKFAWREYIEPIRGITAILDDKLTTTHNLPSPIKQKIAPNPFAPPNAFSTNENIIGIESGKVELEASVSDDTQIKQLSFKIDDKIYQIQKGLSLLAGREEVVTYRITNVETIRDFYNNLRGGPWTSYTDNIDDSELQPFLIVGPRQLVEAILYGTKSSKTLRNNTPLPTNIYAEYRKTANENMKDYVAPEDLHKQNPKEDKSKENLIEDFLTKTASQLSEDVKVMFRYNIFNPNVISIKSENSDLFSQLLVADVANLPKFISQYNKVQVDTRQQLYNQLSQAQNNILTKLLDAFGGGDINKFFEIARQVGITDINERNKIAEKVGKKLQTSALNYEDFARFALSENLVSEQMGNLMDPNIQNPVNPLKLNDEATIQMISTILQYLLKKQNLEKNLVDIFVAKINLASNSSTASVVDAYDALMKTLANSAFNIEITTLPLFVISDTEFFARSYTLQANRVTLVGNKNVYTSDRFLSGLYSLQGFKHTIDAKTCQSAFYLTRGIEDGR